jgi:hypothetical protein
MAWGFIGQLIRIVWAFFPIGWGYHNINEKLLNMMINKPVQNI